ncbi:MAG: NUDIX domain-containing protein [bacterium]|nr:NUDIX domain-containing protein [bacterium]
MELPLILLDNLDINYISRWQHQFLDPGRKSLEGIWRRTQNKENHDKSGWEETTDMRRKMVHYIDEFDMKDFGNYAQLLLVSPYLWVHYAFPDSEIEVLDQIIDSSLKQWERRDGHYVLEDLIFIIDKAKPPLDDVVFPKGYSFRSYTLLERGAVVSTEKQREPWDILKMGIRKIQRRGHPKKIQQVGKIVEFLPAHLELGCGPSIEAGIPPLHYLHDVFGISDPQTGQFLLDLTKDTLIPSILRDPRAFYRRSSLPYRQALTAPLTDFYQVIKKFYERGLILDPVITNNFDGLPSLIGMKEQYVRRYAESEIIPKIDFNPEARALIVVGSHADRRRTQEAARQAGLQVIYVDPERFEQSGKAYPLEAPQDEDFVINMTGQEFAEELEGLSKRPLTAIGFLFNPKNKKVLLHLRDNNAKQNPNKWAFFGGASDGNESPKQCFARELNEEIELDVLPQDMKYLRGYFNEKVRQQQYIFYVESDIAKENLNLKEGAGLEWISLERINEYDLYDKAREDLEFFKRTVLI